MTIHPPDSQPSEVSPRPFDDQAPWMHCPVTFCPECGEPLQAQGVLVDPDLVWKMVCPGCLRQFVVTQP